MVFLSLRKQTMSFKPSLLKEAQDHGAADALTETLEATLTRWREESLQLDRSGAYAWLANRVIGQRVLEVGCGFGTSTVALAHAGKTVFALDNRLDCLEATQLRVPDATYGVADLHQYDERLLTDLSAFAPDSVVCWIAGAPASALPRDVPSAYAVMQHRLALQQAVIHLATKLNTVQSVHLADRTAFPWKMKDAGRQTLTRMVTSVVLPETPFTLAEADVQFRKIGQPLSAKIGAAALQGVVPVVGEATIRRNRRPS